MKRVYIWLLGYNLIITYLAMILVSHLLLLDDRLKAHYTLSRQAGHSVYVHQSGHGDRQACVSHRAWPRQYSEAGIVCDVMNLVISGLVHPAVAAPDAVARQPGLVLGAVLVPVSVLVIAGLVLCVPLTRGGLGAEGGRQRLHPGLHRGQLLHCGLHWPLEAEHRLRRW